MSILSSQEEPSVTFIVTAYNEALFLEKTIEEVQAALRKFHYHNQIIIVDDCSSDSTNDVAKKLAEQAANITVIRNKSNLGFGGAYRQGLLAAKTTHVMLVGGDNSINRYAIASILCYLEAADIVVPYIANPDARSIARRILSSSYTVLVNLIFGYRLRYYNGLNILPTQLARQTTFSNSFAFNVEMVVQILGMGASYIQAPQHIMEQGDSSAVSFKNVTRTMKEFCRFALRLRAAKLAAVKADQTHCSTIR